MESWAGLLVLVVERRLGYTADVGKVMGHLVGAEVEVGLFLAGVCLELEVRESPKRMDGIAAGPGVAVDR